MLRTQLTLAALLLAPASLASAQSVFHVSGPAAGGDTAGDLFLDHVDYGNGATASANDLVFVSHVNSFSWSGGRKKLRVVSGANTTGTSGFHRLEAEDGDASDLTQLDQDLFNMRLEAAFSHGNLNNLFDQRHHEDDWAFVIEFERELVDDDSGDDARGELLVFERNCDGELYIQALDESGNSVGSGYTVRTSDYVGLTPDTRIDKFDKYGVVTGDEPLGAVSLDLSADFGVTHAKRFIVCNTTNGQRDSDFKLIGVDTLGTDCNGNGVNDTVEILNGGLDVDQNGVLDVCEPGVWVFCTGEGASSGTSVDCPCGNNVAPGAAEGCANSSGAGASLSASGSTSIAAADLSLHVAGLPAAPPGVFFAGDGATAGGAGVPFLSGLRCVSGNVVRLAKIPATPGGQANLPGPGFPPIHQMVGAQPGQTQYFQFWYRDAQGPCGHSANMTNGLRVVWGL